MLQITLVTTWTDILLSARVLNRLVYAMNTCWWKIGNPIYTHPNGSNLPCGPRREMLMETDDPNSFLTSAQNNVKHYGPWGIGALLVAYHGNLVTDTGFPTSLETWDKYTEVMNQYPNMEQMLEEAGLPSGLISLSLRNPVSSVKEK